MNLLDRESLFQQLEAAAAERRRPVTAWLDVLRSACQRARDGERHGTLAEWITAWQQLPSGELLRETGQPVRAEPELIAGHVTIRPPGGSAVLSAEQLAGVRQTLRQFHPWRKGPFDLYGVRIDTEWRSDWKWERLAPHLALQDQLVLDVGCGNGYYGWRMLQAGARLVCGLDPFLLYVMQYEVVRRLLGADVRNFVVPGGDDLLPDGLRLFDTVFSMGVLYHRTSPVEHLQSLWHALRPGGTLILETLVIHSDQPQVLVPEDRYAKMRNVWFIPSLPMLLRWLHRTGFRQCEVLDVSVTTKAEQRTTEWMTFESLADFLDPTDPSRTIEGYPGPVRAIVRARTA